jgi:hypothetical protein
MINHASHQQHPENCAPESSSSIWLKRAAIGTALVAGALLCPARYSARPGRPAQPRSAAAE